MDYKTAGKLLDSVALCTDNQVELLVSYIQKMRLCQRESQNKDFYNYSEFAVSAMRRIDEEIDALPERLKRRMVYARSEYSLVVSTYYYYIGQDSLSVSAMNDINPSGEIQKDTAQYLNYLYQIGAGGIITKGTHEEIIQKEWDYLMHCYMMSRQSGSLYWEANSLQAMSEHLFDSQDRDILIKNNPLTIQYINEDLMPDSLLAGYVAQKSLDMFIEYGDVYQMAGAYRSLASCYWTLGDYHSALICLGKALHHNEAIDQAPDLVASIYERLSLTYSAMNDKPSSDYYRNLYLDMQDKTRQDRQLEARAEQLERNSSQLNMMLAAVMAMIAVVVFIFFFYYLRKKKSASEPLAEMLVPLEKWQKDNERKNKELQERREEINEEYAINMVHITDNKKRNMENRAKVFLVNTVMPFIDRILHELECLVNKNEPECVRDERFVYITELTDKINDINDFLTQWIQLQKGQLNLRIESFRLQEILDVVKKSRMSFKLKGIDLVVEDTADVVKADKVLTLFMVNTIADNARKFTGNGGMVTISSVSTDSYVEISVKDTGVGMSEDKLSKVFDHKISNGHGFGLINCKGIIEKYRKISRLFDVCTINAESEEGKGSRFYFRLPKGIARLALLALVFSANGVSAKNMEDAGLLDKAEQYADSVYYSNIKGDYGKTILWADSAIRCFNDYFASLHPESRCFMMLLGKDKVPAEIKWFREKVPVDYGTIMSVRNETAVAALALHDWPLYHYCNSAYTQLYKEASADSSLGEYIKIMQRSESNKHIAISLLVILLLMIIVAYYMLYYRPRLYFRFCMEKVKGINDMLMEDIDDRQKLHSLDTNYSIQKFPDSLKNIVAKIRGALEESVKASDRQRLSIELAEDELRRLDYENRKLYVSNSVLDNCLSALKHETMYYPSRIKQLLISGNGDSLNAMQELVLYYKQLYAMLSAQAMRQIDSSVYENRPVRISDIKQVAVDSGDKDIRVLGDFSMIEYLFGLLQKQCGEKTIHVEISEKDNKYVILKALLPSIPCRDIFTLSVQNVPFFICRQIVRENSSHIQLHGCGVVAESYKEGMAIVVTLAKA